MGKEFLYHELSFIYLFIYLFVYLFIYLFICLCYWLFIYSWLVQWKHVLLVNSLYNSLYVRAKNTNPKGVKIKSHIHSRMGSFLDVVYLYSSRLKTNTLNIYHAKSQGMFSDFHVLIAHLKTSAFFIFLKLSGEISQIFGPENKRRFLCHDTLY